MRTVLYVLIGLAILVVAYLIFFKKKDIPSWITGDNTGAGTGTGTAGDGSLSAGISEQPVPSRQVSMSEIMPAGAPSSFLNSVTESNALSYNLFTSKITIYPRIHLITNFSSACQQYVWYNHSLYTLESEKTDNQGNKTCQYAISRSVFPDQIKVRVGVGGSCTVYKYYTSGIEYLYSETKTEQNGMIFNTYCIYKKQ